MGEIYTHNYGSSPTFQLNYHKWLVFTCLFYRYTIKRATLHLISPTFLPLIEEEDVVKNNYHKINFIIIYVEQFDIFIFIFCISCFHFELI